MSKEQQTEPASAELVPVEPESQGTGLSSLGDVMNTGQLKAAIKTAETQRQLIKDFVKNQLVDGVDYGVIVGGKPTLLKPGQEKIFSLMKLTSRLEKDTDTLEMLGNAPGTVAYLCRVYRGGEEIAQGRGAAVVGDKKRDANSTVKIAEKRARMDACLSLGFSEFFTQDMDDPDYRDRGNSNDNAATARPRTDNQAKFIMDLFRQKGVTNVVATLKANGIDPNAMTFEQASSLIEVLKADTYKRAEEGSDDQQPPAGNEPTEGEIVSDPEQDAARGDGDAMASLAEDRGRAEEMANVAVTPELKGDIDTMMADLSFNQADKLTFVRKVTGRPYMPTNDADWRKVWVAINEEVAKNTPPATDQPF